MTRRNTISALRRGFTLTENLVSISIISIMIPTALLALTQSLSFQRDTNLERKALSISQYLFSEIPFIWRPERSTLFPAPTPEVFPLFNKDTSYSVLFNNEGLLFAAKDTSSKENRAWKTSNPEQPQLINPNGFVATISSPLGSLSPSSNRLKKLQISISFPAGQPAANRQTFSYCKLFREP